MSVYIVSFDCETLNIVRVLEPRQLLYILQSVVREGQVCQTAEVLEAFQGAQVVMRQK